MDNNNNNNNNNKNPEGEDKVGRTLDLQNVSISTLKDDLAKENSDEKKEDSAGWFNFLAKHKTTNNSSATPPDSTEPAAGNGESPAVGGPVSQSPESEVSVPIETGQGAEKVALEQKTNPLTSALGGLRTSNDFLEKELDEFKTESEPAASSDTVEAPLNLPIADAAPLAGTSAESPETQEISAGKEGEKETEEAGGIPDLENSIELADTSESQRERPALGSFFPKNEGENEKDNEEDKPFSLDEVMSDKSDKENLKEKTISETLLNEGGDNKTQVSKIEPLPQEGIAGSLVEGAGKTEEPEELEEEPKEENPFSARIEQRKPEEKSLLQAVESAINYSAPPEFAEKRKAREEGSEDGSEEGQVVDLRKKPELERKGLLGNKKMLIIFGGAGGIALVAVFILFLVLGGGGTQQKPTTPAPAASQENKNNNANLVNPIKPITPTPTKPTVLPQKVLSNAEEINVGSLDEINTAMEKIRRDQAVQKQTQLIFLKSDGSAASFQDLMDATGINIPQKVLPQPGAAPALIFTDFFQGKSIFGLIIPTTENAGTAATKMNGWENTMVLDLGQLWKGINIDNQAAYFADSKIFSQGRFALIDKKNNLSLDYIINDGYIFIACGKDSMTILKNQFTGSKQQSENGIKWEDSSSASGSSGAGESLQNQTGNSDSTAAGASNTGTSSLNGNINTSSSAGASSGSSSGSVSNSNSSPGNLGDSGN